MLVPSNSSKKYISQPIQSSTISPKIAIWWDKKHSDPFNQKITKSFYSLNTEFTMLHENNLSEMRNHYSVELLDKDKKKSTACSVYLLTATCLAYDYKNHYRSVLLTIYMNPEFRSNFYDKDYENYCPSKWDRKVKNWVNPFDKMTPRQKELIKMIRNCFKEIDQKYLEKDNYDYNKNVGDYVDLTCKDFILAYTDSEKSIILKMAEAIAFQEIRKIKPTLENKFNYPEEIDISFIHKFHALDDKTGYALCDFRSYHQVEKIILVIEKIFDEKLKYQEKSDFDNHIFVVRLGINHKKIVTEKLREYFPYGDFKEIVFDKNDDLNNPGLKIKSLFAAVPLSSPENTKNEELGVASDHASLKTQSNDVSSLSSYDGFPLNRLVINFHCDVQ